MKGPLKLQDRSAPLTTQIRVSGLELLALVVAPTVAACHALRVFQAAISDDAYILYRYADHVAGGHGFVWNIGGNPIEGFTSLLHVVVLALATWLGGDLLLSGQVLGIAGAMLSCAAALLLGKAIGEGDRRVGIVAAFMVALSPALAAWARGGLETTLFAALLSIAMATWILESRRATTRWLSGIAFFAATLSRPEALGIALLTAVVDVFRRRSADRRNTVGAVVAWWPLGVAMVGLLLWKVAVFGEIVPNTYHAKAGGGGSPHSCPAHDTYSDSFVRMEV